MRYERILAEITSAPWMIERTAGERMFDLISRRVSGHTATAADLATAAGVRAARDQRKAKDKPRGVAVLPLYGPMVKRADLFSEVSGLASTDQIAAWVDAAAADPNIKAIIIDVDSPGGSVHGTEELAQRITAATKAKKVIAVANATAASAAYYVASQASELVVTPSGWVGSVGVLWTYLDDSEQEKKAGVTRVVVATSETKAQNGGGPLTPAGRAEMEQVVAGYYEQFVRAVARGRNVSQTTVRDNFGGGGMVLADKAVKLGMANRVGTLEDVLGRYGMSSADLTPAASFDVVHLAAKSIPLRFPVSDEQVDAFSPRLMPTGEKFDPELELRRRKLRRS